MPGGDAGPPRVPSPDPWKRAGVCGCSPLGDLRANTLAQMTPKQYSRFAIPTLAEWPDGRGVPSRRRIPILSESRLRLRLGTVSVVVLAGLTLALLLALAGLTLGIHPPGTQSVKRLEASSQGAAASERRPTLAHRHLTASNSNDPSGPSSAPSASTPSSSASSIAPPGQGQLFLPLAGTRGRPAGVASRDDGPHLRPAFTPALGEPSPPKPAPVDPRQHTPILPAVAPPPPPRTLPPPRETDDQPSVRALAAARPPDPSPLPDERQPVAAPRGAGLAGQTEVPAAPTRAGPPAAGRFAESFPRPTA